MQTQTPSTTRVLRSEKMSDGLVKRNATYADLEDLPEGKVGELIEGNLYVFRRPRIAHSRAVSSVFRQLGPAEDDTSKKGWVILFEVEIWLDKKHTTLLVPDLAGWRRERMTEIPDVQTLELVPDWVCEGLSPATARHDKGRKREIYAKNRIGHLWYADPKLKTLEILTLKGGEYRVTHVAGGSERGVFAPFTHEIDLSKLWSR
jgi:Uma2 family endonuclease